MISVCEGYNALSICWVPQPNFLHFLQLLQLSVQISVKLLQICLKCRYIGCHKFDSKYSVAIIELKDRIPRIVFLFTLA